MLGVRILAYTVTGLVLGLITSAVSLAVALPLLADMPGEQLTSADLGEVIAVRSMVYLALTYDHRIVDGADAARFLTTVRERLEAGQFHGELGLA